MSNSTNGFIKFNRNNNDNFLDILLGRHTAFCLLALIAYRSKRQARGKIKILDVNQCYIGDYESYGVTEQIYRTDKRFLEEWEFVSFKATSKGTVATLIDTTIFDINPNVTNDQTNDQLTTNQRPANDQTNDQTNDQATTKQRPANDQSTTNQRPANDQTNDQTNDQLTTNKETKKETKKERKKEPKKERKKERKKEKNIKKENKWGSIKKIREDTEKLEEIAKEYKVPIDYVYSKIEDIDLWQKSKGKSYKDYNAALRNWLKKDKESGKLPTKKPTQTLAFYADEAYDDKYNGVTQLGQKQTDEYKIFCNDFAQERGYGKIFPNA